MVIDSFFASGRTFFCGERKPGVWPSPLCRQAIGGALRNDRKIGCHERPETTCVTGA